MKEEDSSPLHRSKQRREPSLPPEKSSGEEEDDDRQVTTDCGAEAETAPLSSTGRSMTQASRSTSQTLTTSLPPAQAIQPCACIHSMLMLQPRPLPAAFTPIQALTSCGCRL